MPFSSVSGAKLEQVQNTGIQYWEQQPEGAPDVAALLPFYNLSWVSFAAERRMECFTVGALPYRLY